MKVTQPAVIILMLLLFVLVPAHSENQPGKKNDLRVLIDVSGSMKKNDPHKLRAPALRLLVGLLPEGSESGIWTFAQYVNMQVKHGRVDSRWKKRARLESEKIHSRGLFTNIEDALKKASFGWNHADTNTRRNLILLTDGMVDISREAKKNEASRQRILNEIIPAFKKAGVRIHSIALSDGADKALLKQISGVTGGSYVQVDNANSLERAFLKLFEKTTPADSLPIKGNRFKVDTSVQDMTVLVFRKESEQVALTTPQGKTIDYHKHPHNFSWSQEQSYELITVKKPAAGEWVVKGSIDPDNRVMIVTNLKLNTRELPPSILAGDEFRVEAELLDKGKHISRKSFLNLVTFEVEVNGEQRYPLNDSGKGADRHKNDGHYSADIIGKLSAGEQSLIIRAKGATFEREFRYTLDNFLSIMDVKLSEDETAENFYLSIIPHLEILDPESVEIELTLEAGDKLDINQEPGGLWISEIKKDKAGKFVLIKLQAKRHTGEQVHSEIKKKLVVFTSKPNHHQPQNSGEYDNEEHKKEADSHENKVAHDVVEEVSGDSEETNWILIGWITMIVNLVVGIIGVLVFQIWKKKKAAKDDEDDKDVAL